MGNLNNLKDSIATLVETLNVSYKKIIGPLAFDALMAIVKDIQRECVKLENNSEGMESAFSEEMVNSPKHYKNGKYEAIDVMLDIFGKKKVSAFCELNAFKYQWRSHLKGTDIQDKKKAIWYLSKYNELNKKENEQ